MKCFWVPVKSKKILDLKKGLGFHLYFNNTYLGGEVGQVDPAHCCRTLRFCQMLGGFWCHKLFLAARTAEEVIPHYAQQLRERVQPDMITLGSLSLQQVRATKRNICVIIPYSPAHQPCPLCCISVVWLMDRERVQVCMYICLILSVQMSVCLLCDLLA